MGMMDKLKAAPLSPEAAAKLAGSRPVAKPAEPGQIIHTRDPDASMRDLVVSPSAQANQADAILRVLTLGDLAKLTVDQKIHHYQAVCERVGLNPLTKPFDYVTIAGKTTMMANKEASAQLAFMHKVTIEIKEFKLLPEINILECWVRASTPDGRFTDELGAVPLSDKVKGVDAANARMKCITKARRRAILAHCGLGEIDESEIETVRGAVAVPAEVAHSVVEIPAGAPDVVRPRDLGLDNVVPAAKPAVVVPAAQSHQSAAVESPALYGKGDSGAGDAIVEGEVVGGEGAESLSGLFRYENKEHRQVLIREIHKRFPGISRDNTALIGTQYKLADKWAAVVRNLDDMVAFEKTKGKDSQLLKGE